MKNISLSLLLITVLVSCGVPKAEYEKLKNNSEKTEKDLKGKLGKTENENAVLKAKLDALNQQANLTKANNQVLLDNMGNLSMLTKKGAENLEKTLESLKEKDNRITSLQDAVNRKDSVTFALIKSLKGSLGNLNDEDITINVEKGVVYISITEKMLFASGSRRINSSSDLILSKVAKIVKDKPDFDFIIEGHTDNQPISTVAIKDNWDLSVLRATSIAKRLVNKHKVDPSRISAAGRGDNLPIASNATREGRKANRRIKVILIPKVDQFTGMIEDTLKN